MRNCQLYPQHPGVDFYFLLYRERLDAFIDPPLIFPTAPIPPLRWLPPKPGIVRRVRALLGRLARR